MKTPVVLPPLSAIRSSETGSWGESVASDWIWVLLTSDVVVRIFTCARPFRSSSRPGSAAAGLRKQIDRALELLGEERALRRRRCRTCEFAGQAVGGRLRLGAELVGAVVRVEHGRQRDLRVPQVGAARRLLDRQDERRVAVLLGRATVADLHRDGRRERHRVAAGRRERVGRAVRDGGIVVADRLAGRRARRRTTSGCERTCSSQPLITKPSAETWRSAGKGGDGSR